MAKSRPGPSQPPPPGNHGRLLSFVYLGSFLADWAGLGLGEEDLEALERTLLDRPGAGGVMRGTGGLRKVRFAPPGSGRGKSGSERVCYALFPAPGLILMVAVFGKSDREDLGPAERNAIAAMLGRFRAQLERREGGRP